MARLFWICVAGALGAGTRHLVSIWSVRQFGPDFPYGTLTVNLAGCFLMAFALQGAFATNLSPTVRAAVTVGFLGGLTTYSSFNLEATNLGQEGLPGLAFVYVGLTVLGGLAAGWLGLVAARQIWPQ